MNRDTKNRSFLSYPLCCCVAGLLMLHVFAFVCHADGDAAAVARERSADGPAADAQVAQAGAGAVSGSGVRDWGLWRAAFERRADLTDKHGGYAFLVLHEGKPVVELVRGYARMPWEREHPSLAMTLDTPVQLASVTKPIVAVAFLRMWEMQGKPFDLDDPIWQHSGRFRRNFAMATPEVRQITYRQLLTHRSGLSGQCWVDHHSLRNSTHLMMTKPLEFQPGRRYGYNNGNYNLLRCIVEDYTGLYFEEYLRRHINEPLGITTLSGENPEPATLHYRQDRQTQGATFSSERGNGWRIGGDAAFASARDLGRFLVGVRQHRMLSEETTRMMFEQRLGWHVVHRWEEGTGWHHNGGWGNNEGSVSTAIVHLPGGIDVVLLCNSNLVNLDTIVQVYNEVRVSGGGDVEGVGE